MNKKFRLALLRDWHKNTPDEVIDFTRYDLPVHEPQDATPGKPIKDWSLINRINQKDLRPQDKPVLLQALEKGDRDLIFSYYPGLY